MATKDYILNWTRNSLQRLPEMVQLKNGNIVVAWEDLEKDPNIEGSFGVYASIFSKDLRFIKTNELRVPQQTIDIQSDAQITALKDGGFAVTWNSRGPSRKSGVDDGYYDTYLRVFNADGSARTREIQLTPQQKTDNFIQDVTTLSDGTLLTIVAHKLAGATYDLVAYRTRPDGTAVGRPKTLVEDIDQITTSLGFFHQPGAEIAAMPGGGYAVTWYGYEDLIPGADGRRIYVQLFDKDGSRRGPKQIVFEDNRGRLLDQEDPHIARLSTGDLAVAWNRDMDKDDLEETDVYLRFLDKTGRNESGAVLVNKGDRNGSQLLGDVVDLGAGKTLVTYYSIRPNVGEFYQDFYALMGRVFDNSGKAVSSVFKIGRYALEDMGNGNALVLDDGRIAFVRDAVTDEDEDIIGTVIDLKLVAQKGGTGTDRMIGTKVDDTLLGLGGNDLLLGDTGSDRLSGGRGKDTLRGDQNADVLAGGAGADTFLFRSARDSTPGAAGRDAIRDFSRSQGDRIDVRVLDADFGARGNQNFAFIGTDPFSKDAGELRYDRARGDTFVYADINGDGRADFAIRIDGSIGLRASDFIL